MKNKKYTINQRLRIFYIGKVSLAVITDIQVKIFEDLSTEIYMILETNGQTLKVTPEELYSMQGV